MDETYVKVAGALHYLCLGVDHGSHTIDLLRHKRDIVGARRLLQRAIALHSEPKKITIDTRGANAAATDDYATSTTRANSHFRYRDDAYDP